MEDIFKDLPSLCDPRPTVSVRSNQGKKKDGRAMKHSAVRSGSRARQVSADGAALSPLALISRSLQGMARAVELSWQRIKAVSA